MTSIMTLAVSHNFLLLGKMHSAKKNRQILVHSVLAIPLIRSHKARPETYRRRWSATSSLRRFPGLRVYSQLCPAFFSRNPNSPWIRRTNAPSRWPLRVYADSSSRYLLWRRPALFFCPLLAAAWSFVNAPITQTSFDFVYCGLYFRLR